MKKLSALIIAATCAAIIATAAAQPGASTPVQAPVGVQTAEQAGAAWAPTCRVQCPGDAHVASAVSCRPMTAACRRIAATNSNCRADLIPANWCASRALPSEGE